MADLKYLVRVAGGMSGKKLAYAIDTVRRHSGRSKLFIFLDMCVCMLRYGAGYFDYMMYGFWDLTAAQRATYVTRLSNKKIQSLMNNDEFSYVFDNKNVFNKLFAKYLRRETLDAETMTEDELAAFLPGKEYIFAKPNKGSCGTGVERLTVADFADVGALYRYIKEKNFGVVEQAVKQHPDMAALYPHSVNCMRIVTDLVDDQVHIAYIVVKMGTHGAVVDNSGQGGVLCAVDPATGKIKSIAVDDYTNTYECHPDTGVSFVGYQLPMVDQAIALVSAAAREPSANQTHHIGWDVAIAEDGPVIIEGNDYPGTDLCQLYAHTPEKCGLLPYYKKLLPNL